jgi:hypothetical protein
MRLRLTWGTPTGVRRFELHRPSRPGSIKMRSEGLKSMEAMNAARRTEDIALYGRCRQAVEAE